MWMENYTEKHKQNKIACFPYKANKQQHLGQQSTQIHVKHAQNANCVLTLWESHFKVGLQMNGIKSNLCWFVAYC